MEEAISPMRRHIHPSSTIGFVSDLDSTNQYALYYASKFIVAPQKLLLKSDIDTLLAVKLKDRSLDKLSSYRIIDSTTKGGKMVLLLSRSGP